MKSIRFNIFATVLLLVMLTAFLGCQNKENINTVVNQLITIENEKVSEGVIALPKSEEWDYIVLTKAYFLDTDVVKEIDLTSEAKHKMKMNHMKYEMRQIYYIKNREISYFEPFNMYLEFENGNSFLIIDRSKQGIRFKQLFGDPIRLILSTF